MTTPPFFRKVNPGDFPVLFISLDLADPAAVDGRRIRRDRAGAADLAASRRRPGAGLRRAEIRRARPGRSGGGGGAQHLARRHPHRRWPRPTPTPRSARCTGEQQTSRCWPPARCARPPTTATSSSPSATARRSSSTRSPTSSTASRTTRSRAGSTTPAPSCWRSSASPTPTPSRSSTAVQGAGCRQFRAQVPAVDPAWTSLIDRSISIRDAVDDVQDTLAIAVRAGDPGDLPVPALGHGDHHSGAGGADLADRHLRGDVRLRLLDQQHDAAGADAVGRLRGRRRHRHAGEHRPPHRGRHAAVRGGAQGLARDRLHHRVDHLLADRGVHPGAADGRHGRPRVPRIRGDDRGRHPALGLRLADADADAVRARAARPSRGHEEKQNFVLRAFEALFEAMAQGLRVGARPGAGATSRSCWWSRSPPSSAPSGSTSSCPRASSRPRTPASCSAITEAQPDISFEAMAERQRKVADIVRKRSGGRLRQLDRRRRRAQFRAQQRPHVRRAEAARRSAARSTPVIGAAAQGRQQRHRHRTSSSSRSRTSTSAAASSKSQYQYTLQSSDTDDALSRWRPSCATRSPRLPACSTSPPTSTSTTRR